MATQCAKDPDPQMQSDDDLIVVAATVDDMVRAEVNRRRSTAAASCMEVALRNTPVQTVVPSREAIQLVAGLLVEEGEVEWRSTAIPSIS